MDENYEWDAADFNSQPGDHDGRNLVSSSLQHLHVIPKAP